MRNKLVLVATIAYTFLAISCSKKSDEILALLQEIKQQNSDLKAQVTSLQKTTDSLSAALKIANQNIAGMDRKIDSIRNQLSSMVSQINALSAQLNQVNINIADLQKRIAELQAKCQELVDLLRLLTGTINLSDGLIAYYPFTGNAGDSSGNGNHGTVSGAILTADRFGNLNQAYSFNGTNSYIDANDNISLRPKNLSVSAWYFTSVNNPFICLLSKTTFSNALNEQYFFDLSDVGIKLNSNCTPNSGWHYYRPNNSSMLELNRWVNIVFTWDGTILKVYKDGVQLGGQKWGASSTLVGNIDDCVGGKLQIGRWWSLDPKWFNGKIDDVRMYNRALTQQEITYLATH